MATKNKSEKELANEKSQRILEGVAYWRHGLHSIAATHRDLSKII